MSELSLVSNDIHTCFLPILDRPLTDMLNVAQMVKLKLK